MERINLDLLRISETFWNDNEEFNTIIPTSDDTYKVIYAGGQQRRKGVAYIMNQRVARAMKYYEAKSGKIYLYENSSKTNRYLHHPSVCTK